LATELYGRSEKYRRNCEQLLSDFACLGIRFHKIRFLQDPQKEDFVYAETYAISPIHSNSRLMESIQKKLESNFDECCAPLPM
jgi:hypothetical protein